MKVLLLNTPSKERMVVRDMAGGLGFDGSTSMVLPPLDLLSYAASLLHQGHEVDLIDADAEGLGTEESMARIRKGAWDVVVAEISLPSIHTDSVFLRRLREVNISKVVAKTGITHPPVLKELLTKSGADLCIFGECDLTIAAVLQDNERGGTARLINGELAMEEESLLQDLDNLPIPARHLVNNNVYTYPLLGPRMTTVQTSRGCPFPCAYYCPYPLVQGTKWRACSPDRVMREIRDIVETLSITKILFRDATFTVDRKRTTEICKQMKENNFDLQWWCETRANCLDEELLHAMRDAGCHGINLGVETGDEEVMKQQAKAGVTIHKLRQIQQIARDIGMQIHFLFMVGLPQETRSSLWQTYKLVRSLRADSIGVTAITPYPGTPLYKEAQEHGWLLTTDWTQYGGHTAVMRTGKLSAEDIAFARQAIMRAQGCQRYPTLRNRLRLFLADRRFRSWMEENEEKPA